MSTAFADIHVDWRDVALCAEADPDLHHPEKGDNSSAAKAVCRRCPSLDDCLDEAIDRDEKHGVWGGMTRKERVKESERRKLPKREGATK